jgi:hypothetical protein
MVRLPEDDALAKGPRSVEHARESGREDVLAVVGGDDAELIDALTPVA